MKLFSATAMAFCLVSETLANPVAWTDNSPRSIDDNSLDKRMATVNTLPLVNPLCDGYSVNVADISAAVNQGANLMGNNKQRAANNYPHRYGNLDQNGNTAFTWANCPPADLESYYEFPVLRFNTNPWLPGRNTQLDPNEPDRAIFQANGATTVTYCGMITHSGNPVQGQFTQCNG